MVFVRRNTAPQLGSKILRNSNLKRNSSLTSIEKLSNCRRHTVINVSTQSPEKTLKNSRDESNHEKVSQNVIPETNANDFFGGLHGQRMLGFETYITTQNKIENSRPGRRWFGGLIDDIKRRYPLYLSDIKDGLTFQCLAAILFISLAQIAGSIAFGSLMATKTENYIGISETLLVSAIGGLIFSFLSGQPILIVATTGPLLLFDAGLYTLCKTHEIDFLSVRIWIGLWLFGIGIIFVAFEGSLIIRFFTRFTQDVFAVLISFLFMAESVSSLVDIFKAHPLSQTYGVCQVQANNSNDQFKCKINAGSLEISQPNTALLSGILMLGTVATAWTLRAFQNSKFLTKSIRNTIGNFAGPLAIGLMVLLDNSIKDTVTDKLNAPEGLQPTHSSRNWIVIPDHAQMNSFVPFFSFFPAALLFVLIFMDVAISELVVSKSENKLVKGGGLHLDVLLISGINAGTCFLGLPWASVAIVRSVAHCSSLTVRKIRSSKQVVTGVREQRLSNVIISMLTGASVIMTQALIVIPNTVIFGIFFFMGLASISGIQFLERVFLFFKLPENYPLVPYARQVTVGKMHLFTLTQLSWLSLLWGIKYTPAALTFPFILILLIPFRFFILPLMFNKDELTALDSSGLGDEKNIQTKITAS